MAFTVAHVAAVVPLARRWPGLLPLSALAAGAVAPDLEYLLRLSTEARYGHGVAGTFSFCLPAGLLALWLFHRVVKAPLVDLLPESVRQRVAAPAAEPFPFLPARRLLLLSAAVLVGTLTHHLWDAFTHQYGLAVQLLPALQTEAFRHGTYYMRWYKFLQVGSTLVGLGLLAFWYAEWHRAAPLGAAAPERFLGPRARAATVGTTAALALGFGLWLALDAAGVPATPQAFRVFVGRFLVGVMAATSAAALVYGAVVALAAGASGAGARVPRPEAIVIPSHRAL